MLSTCSLLLSLAVDNSVFLVWSSLISLSLDVCVPYSTQYTVMLVIIKRGFIPTHLSLSFTHIQAHTYCTHYTHIHTHYAHTYTHNAHMHTHVRGHTHIHTHIYTQYIHMYIHMYMIQNSQI